MKLERNASKETKIFNIWFAKISDPLTAKMRHFKIWVVFIITVNTYNTATVFTGVISPPHSSEYLQHSYSVYRGHLSTSFQWILTTQLQCLQGSSFHLIPVNTYNTATVFTGVISAPHSSEYLQHSYSVYRGHLSTSFQWILTTQLQYLQGSSLHLIPLALLPQSIQVGQQSPSNVTTLLHLPMSGQGFLWQVTLPRSHIHFSQDDDIGTKVLPVT